MTKDFWKYLDTDIFHKCLNFKWEDLEQKFLFSIFFLGDRGAFVAQNIIDWNRYSMIELFTSMMISCQIDMLVLMHIIHVCTYIFMIITYITILWQGTPRAFCVRSPQWVGAAGGRGYAPSRLRVPQKCGSQYN